MLVKLLTYNSLNYAGTLGAGLIITILRHYSYLRGNHLRAYVFLVNKVNLSVASLWKISYHFSPSIN